MSPLILSLISLVAKLIQLGVDAAKASQDQHADILKKYDEALSEGQAAIDKLKSDFAQRDAVTAAVLDSLEKRG